MLRRAVPPSRCQPFESAPRSRDAECHSAKRDGTFSANWMHTPALCFFRPQAVIDHGSANTERVHQRRPRVMCASVTFAARLDLDETEVAKREPSSMSVTPVLLPSQPEGQPNGKYRFVNSVARRLA